MDTQKVKLTKTKEPYLVTLYGKALDSRAPDSILHDTFADDVVRRIDFDFESLKVPKAAAITLPVRAKILDDWTREFLAAHPAATVLGLGCGLDSRVFRVDPPAGVRWYDIDYPEVIALRQQVYPARHDTTLIGAPVTDPGWLADIPGDRPVIVVAEGLVQYLPEAEGLALFRRITEKFPNGQFVFDSYSRFTNWLISASPAAKTAGIKLTWAIDDPHLLETQIPRLKLLTTTPFMCFPDLARLGRGQAIMCGMMRYSKFMRQSMQHLRYAF